MASTKTYHVGYRAIVHRLDDLTGPWIDVSVSNIFPDTDSVSFALNDVETDPLNANRVIAIGSINNNPAYSGIFSSMDGGLTWNIPSGDYVNYHYGLTQWHEISFFDSNNIVVVGDAGNIAISTDGGLTFNLKPQLIPLFGTNALIKVENDYYIQNIYSVHYAKLDSIVIGTEWHTCVSNDGGNTWTVLNGGIPLVGIVDPNITGVHISQTGTDIVIVNANRIWLSTDSGVSFDVRVEWPLNSGLHLTWIDDTNLWAFGQYHVIYQSTNGGNTWNLLDYDASDDQPRYAGHFYSPTDGFYSGSYQIYSTLDGAATGILSEESPQSRNIKAVWTTQNPEEVFCFNLKDCITQEIVYTIRSTEPNPNELPDLTTLVGQTLGNFCFTEPFGGCVQGCLYVEINESLNCNNAINYSEVLSFDVYDNCINCNIPTYQIDFCEPDLEPYITNDDLSANLIGTYTVCIDGECRCAEITQIPTVMGLPITSISETAYDCCDACLQTCYLLTDCSGAVDPFVTCTDLSEYLYGTIKIKMCGNICWKVEPSPDCFNSQHIDEVIAYYPGNPGDTDNCVYLVDQDGLYNSCLNTITWTVDNIPNVIPAIGMLTNNELLIALQALNLGEVSYNGTSFTVVGDHVYNSLYFLYNHVGGPQCEVPPTPRYIFPTCTPILDNSCEECQYVEPIPPTPLELHLRKIKPGYSSNNSCLTTEYIERINCTFANQVYNEMLVKRYGITVCCEQDVDTWDVKKEILDFQALTDPELCKSTLCKCIEPCILNVSISMQATCKDPVIIDIAVYFN